MRHRSMLWHVLVAGSHDVRSVRMAKVLGTFKSKSCRARTSLHRLRQKV